ncbi:glycosyltransferase [Roseivivax sp. THAF30]|uniref:glycosyltransferase n=1 Tax=Roseivivax sp. THAF30 TaxID=2587852 RepID=UPI0012698653|nr:glycosyltransferase [Roseivivax sp. THAF30]QFT62743.1 GDP-mannose:cellobiosyl-diphosphopolyprenol alpha-mannosyltransferase [Roseivivax sp. THAF30]
MRIVHVASDLVRRAAGVREVVLGLAQAQSAIGMDVAVLGLNHPDWPAEREVWNGISTRVVPVFGPRRLGYAPSMTAALNEMAPDIIHLHGLWMYPGCSVLQWHRATGFPYVISPHGMLSDIALSYSVLKKRFVSLWFQDAVLHQAAALHATSEAEAEEIYAYGLRAPVCVVPNGIAEVSRPTGVGAEGRTILSLGRIHRKKALDHLIMAWQTLEPNFPEWSVLIAGPDEGGEVSRLQSLIEETGVQRVTIHGPVYGAEKNRLMATAGLFALPTHSENFAITVAESLMLEVPVVSSQGAPWSGLEKENCGRWVPIGAPYMSAALREMMSLTDAERRDMGARGRAWMLRDFSWPSVAEQLQHCYMNALDAGG